MPADDQELEFLLKSWRERAARWEECVKNVRGYRINETDDAMFEQGFHAATVSCGDDLEKLIERRKTEYGRKNFGHRDEHDQRA